MKSLNKNQRLTILRLLTEEKNKIKSMQMDSLGKAICVKHVEEIRMLLSGNLGLHVSANETLKR